MRKARSKQYVLPTGSKLYVQLGLLLLLVVGTIFGVSMVQRQQQLASLADLGDPSVNASMWLSNPTPANPQVVGSNFTTSIMVNTGGQGIIGVDSVVNFDPSLLQVISVTPTANNGFRSYPLASFKNDVGEVLISGNVGGSGEAITSSALNVGTITFRVMAPITSTNIGFQFTLGNRNDSNVVPLPTDRLKGVVDLLSAVTPLVVTTMGSPAPSPSLTPSSPGPSPLPSPIPSPTPSPIPSVIPSPIPSPLPSPTPTPIPLVDLTVKLGLQGRYAAEDDRSTGVSITYLHLLSQEVGSSALLTNPAGETLITLPESSYIFLIKTPSYLARKYGTLASPLLVQLTAPIIDLSADPLLGGDFNNDGIINEIDYAALFMPAFGSTDEEMDLDASGQVNNLDFAIMRGNWGLVDDTL